MEDGKLELGTDHGDSVYDEGFVAGYEQAKKDLQKDLIECLVLERPVGALLLEVAQQMYGEAKHGTNPKKLRKVNKVRATFIYKSLYGIMKEPPGVIHGFEKNRTVGEL